MYDTSAVFGLWTIRMAIIEAPTVLAIQSSIPCTDSSFCLSPYLCLEVRGTYSWLHSRSYTNLIRPLGGVSWAMIGLLYVE